ncbi:MAG: VWA domain-containing protein [Candidatus Altiarchaeota archaeon]
MKAYVQIGILTCLLFFSFAAGAYVLKSDDVVASGIENVTWAGLRGITNHSFVTPTTIAARSGNGKADDWAYDPGSVSADGIMAASASGGILNGLSQGLLMKSAPRMMAESAASDTIGFSAGGAKDVNSFRENIRNGFLPLESDITYEGLFYDYSFDTGRQKACSKLFCPSYSYAVSKDPLSGRDDVYLSVGLDSGMRQEDFERKRLNLVIVLDVSGSMGSQFDRYYYDRAGGRASSEPDADAGRSKMEVATKSVNALLDRLDEGDRVGIVLFDQSSYLAKPMNRVGDTDMDAIKAHVLSIRPRGSTNMEAGMRMGTELFGEYLEADPSEYENRVIFLTDAMPNTGQTGEESLLGQLRRNADKGIYATFIGIGVDFNTELAGGITKVRGANYYSVHSPKEFEERMADGFDYMVSPLVFDLRLSLDSPGYEILKVYGSPEADEATGDIMRINTLFPSKNDAGEVKGGIVLLKLRKTSDDGTLRLKVSYEDRNGRREYVKEDVEVEDVRPDDYPNSGIRKGILLARYADLMKSWIIDEREGAAIQAPVSPYVNEDVGIRCPRPIPPRLGRWERQSMPLIVSGGYPRTFGRFETYFRYEMAEIGDDSLGREVEVLGMLGPSARKYGGKVDDWAGTG